MLNNYAEIADAKYDGVRNKTFDTLGQRLNQDSADLKSLQDQVDNIKISNTSNTNQLNDKINTANSDITTIKNNVTTNTNDITSAKTDITDLDNTKIDKPNSTTVNNIPKFSSTNGDLKPSGVSVDDSNNLSANTFKSTVADGTAPFQVISTTKVTNLNSDKLDGYEATDFLRVAQVFSSLGDSGYFKLPNSDASGKPIIIQWGTGTTGTAATAGAGLYASNTPAINFPIKFPTACVFSTAMQSATSAAWISPVTTTLEQITVYLTSTDATAASNKAVKWFAIGY